MTGIATLDLETNMELLADAVKNLLGVEPSMAITYLLCVLIGVGINWAKSSREANISLMSYWTRYPVRSQTAIIGTISAYLFTVITDPESGKLTYIAIGYACDNLLNKVPVEGKAADIIARQEAAVIVQEQRIRELTQSLPQQGS